MAQLAQPLVDRPIDHELEHVVWQSALDLRNDRPEDHQVIVGIADLLIRNLTRPQSTGPLEDPLTSASADLVRALPTTSQSHLRQCGRLLLQRLMTRLTALGAGARVLAHVADAYFSCYDQLARVRVTPYGEDEISAGERRRRLLTMIIGQPLVAPDDIDALATALGWPVPDTLAMVALAPRPDAPADPPFGLPADILADFRRGDPLLVLPHPDICGSRLDGLLRHWRVAIGPAVPFARAAVSLRRARDLLGLLQTNVIDDTAVARYTEHLATLLVFRDPELVETIVQVRLAPLATLPKATADRLAETLLAWIQHAGSVPATAQSLHLHPQTVRYRMRQLEALFRDALHDPRQRLELEAALRRWLSTPAPAGRRPVPKGHRPRRPGTGT